MIVATAGHVDHGKTALIRALTGVDTDRLPEEKQRGLTIDLGFAYLPLADGSVLGFIDVPGHEKFVRNMVAGVAAIDIALLVVAADDGVMPQTREHVAVLDLLGVGDGIVALTKLDLVAAERVHDASAQIGELLAGTALEGSLILPVAAPKGIGIAALKDRLLGLAATRAERSAAGSFRLAVDRSFTIRGAGTVVTGTVHAGRARVGDGLVVAPAMREVRLRGIHAQDRPSEEARAGWRCALNLAGVDKGQVARGDWIVAEARPSRRLDLRLRVLAGEERALKHWTPVHVHHGAGHATGHAAVIGAGAIVPGESGLAQLVLDAPAVAVAGDRVVLRDQSARRTVGGGRVIDPFGPARGRSRPERIARLDAMDVPDHDAALAALLALSDTGIALEEFRLARNLTVGEAADLYARADLVTVGGGADARGLAPDRLAALAERLETETRSWHARFADRLGPTPEELRRASSWGQDRNLLHEEIAALVAQGRLRRRGSVLHAPDHDIRLTPGDEALWSSVRDRLQPAEGSPPALWQLAEATGAKAETLDAFLLRLVGLGLVVRIAKNRYLAPADVLRYARIAEELAIEDEAGLAPASFRDAAGVGRNFAIDFLEFLDRSGLTLRQGTRRSLRRATADVFGDPSSLTKDRTDV